MLRSALYTLGLARRRLARRTGASFLVAAGIAAGAAVVFGVQAGTTVAQDRAVGQAVERIPEGSRSLRAVWFGVPGQADEPQPVLARRARAALAQAGAGAATGLVLLRESTLAGTFAGLGGVEGLGRFVELRSGRLPARCEPQRCEVLRLRGEGRLPRPDGLRLVEVGEAALVSRVLFGDFLAPTDNALGDAMVSPSLQRAAGYHRPPPAPLFLAEGVDAIAGAPALSAVYRSYAWVAPLEPGTPRLWEVDAFARGVERARSELQARTRAFDVVAPVEELREAQAAAREAGHRLALVGGQAAALLFAFAVLAALAGRRDAEAARRRLRLYGARRWQLVLLTLAEAAAVAVAGVAVGFGLGVAAGALAADRAGSPVLDVLRQSVLSDRGLALAAAVAAASAAILATSLAAAPARGWRLRVTPLDALALAALLLVAAAVWGGVRGDLVLVVPALAAFTAAVVVARLLPPALRGLERLARRRALSLRLAALSLARAPGHAVVATAFLVVSFGLALFAEGYRATLAQSARDAAAFAVPRDYLLRQDLTRLVPVREALTGGARQIGFGVDVDPVLRLTGSVARQEGESGITLLGLPAASLARLRGWRDGWADAPRAELARRLQGAGELRGPRLPPGLDVLRLRVSGGDVGLFAEIEGRDGFLRVPLGRTNVPVLAARLPAEARGGRVVGLVLEPAGRILERGADAGKAVEGELSVTVDGLPRLLEGWTGVGGARLDGTRIAYTLTNVETTRVRPRQPYDAAPVPVLATPRLAAAADAAGLLPLQIAGERLTARVVGEVERFPGVRGQAVVGDVGALSVALNMVRPGAARVDEAWIGLGDERSRADVERVLAAPPLHVLDVRSRRALEADGARDPLAHGTLLALAAAALVALGLALAGIVLTVLGDLRDERGEFFDLEAEGAPPRLLRRVVRLRALAVVAAGLAGGAVTGVLLGGIVTDLVGLTARVARAEPPLRYALEPGVVALGLALFATLGAALVLAATRRGFGAPVPPRAEVLE